MTFLINSGTKKIKEFGNGFTETKIHLYTMQYFSKVFPVNGKHHNLFALLLIGLNTMIIDTYLRCSSPKFFMICTKQHVVQNFTYKVNFEHFVGLAPRNPVLSLPVRHYTREQQAPNHLPSSNFAMRGTFCWKYASIHVNIKANLLPKRCPNNNVPTNFAAVL